MYQQVLFHVGHCQPATSHRKATKGCREAPKAPLPHAKTWCSPRPPSPLLPGGGGERTRQGEGRERGPRTKITAKNNNKKIKSQGERLAICRVGAGAGAARQPYTATAAWVPPAPSDSALGREGGMLWDPSALGPMHPETCPGRDSRGRHTPPPGGSLQAGAAGNPSWLGSNPSHLWCFLGKEEKPGGRGDFFFFHRSCVSMAPSREVLLHRPTASWGPAAR